MKTTTFSLKKNILLVAALIIASIAVVAMAEVFGIIINLLVIGIILFIAFFFISLKYPRYNIIILLGCNYILSLLIKVFNLYDVPFGVVNEALCATMFITLMLNNKISGIKTLPGILLIVWIFYQVIELANPYAYARITAFYSIRSLIPFVSCFFVMYSSVEGKKDINIFMIGWLALGLLASFYCLYQEFAGLPSYDYAYVTKDENLFRLFFTWGRLRKFSFFFNPSEFGMLMSLTGVAAFVIFFYAKDMKMRIFSGATCFFTFWSMLYTGSRTAMVMLPVGLLIFSVITLHPRALIMVALAGVLGGAMILRPASGAMYVMSTAFSGADDPSMNLRIKNREMIRTYILTNPIGYGLGGTGYLGKKYAPNTLIGTFDTDSEYVRVAVEIGWLGLLLWIAILAAIFSFGVNLYFKTKDQEWRTIITVALVYIFMIIVAQYAQEIFVSFLIPTLLACMIGVIAKIHLKLSKPDAQVVVE